MVARLRAEERGSIPGMSMDVSVCCCIQTSFRAYQASLQYGAPRKEQRGLRMTFHHCLVLRLRMTVFALSAVHKWLFDFDMTHT
jgi:hypothetical protein